jgi:hypothetical protein
VRERIAYSPDAKRPNSVQKAIFALGCLYGGVATLLVAA